MAFLSHLGVRQHDVHKRISDTLMKSLVDEVQKASPGGGGKAGLLDLLKSCWMYATTIPELRPVLWAVLKQLGEVRCQERRRGKPLCAGDPPIDGRASLLACQTPTLAHSTALAICFRKRPGPC
jgi:hypothetical protein